MAEKKVYKVAHKFDLDQGETSISTSIQVQVASDNGDHAKEVAMQHMKKLAAFAVHGSHSITDEFKVEPVEGKDSEDVGDDAGHEEENEQSVARDYWASQNSSVMASKQEDDSKLVAEAHLMLEAKLHLKEQITKRRATDVDAIKRIAQELRYKYPALSSSYREEITQQVISELE